MLTRPRRCQTSDCTGAGADDVVGFIKGMARGQILTCLAFSLLLNGGARSTAGQSAIENAAEYREYLARANTGDGDAMNEIGVASAEGLFTRSSQRRAVYWFRRAAAVGNAHGAGNLGLHYVRGHGVRRDRVLAAKWFMICHALDGLRCQPEDFLDPLRLPRHRLNIAWQAALVWLRAHPDLRNNFRERPWLGEGEYPSVVRF